MRNLLCISALVAMAGCAYDEGLVINNLRGTVRLPAEAAQGQLFDANGDPQEVEDVGFIGPVFLGLYSEVAPPLSLEDYPHPARGPQFEPGVPAEETALIISLREGFGSIPKMPMGGPFLKPGEIDEIARWIDAWMPE